MATITAVKKYRSVDLTEAEARINGDLSEFNIHVSADKKQQYRHNIQEKYIDDLVTQLENRFPDSLELEAFSLLDPSKLPEKATEVTEYGNDKVAVLGAKYAVSDSADFKLDDLKSEWETFKHLLADSFKEMSMQAVLKELAVPESTLATMYPCLSKLASIALVLPISTAECERSFSAMKRVKTELRNRIVTKTLDHLLRISISGPDLKDFDFDTAVDEWGAMRNRRIQT